MAETDVSPKFGTKAGPVLTSPAVRDALVAAVECGVPVMTAWRAAGLTIKGFYDLAAAVRDGRWRNGMAVEPDTLAIITEFVDRIEVARAQHEQTIVEAIHHAATTPNEKTGIPDWRAGQFLLRSMAHTRERWHEYKPPTEVRTLPGGERPQSLKDIPEAQLIEAAGWKELLEPSDEAPSDAAD